MKYPFVIFLAANILISCSDNQQVAENKNSEDKKQVTNIEDKKEILNGILDRLEASLFDKCVSFPLIIQYPYNEYNAATVGGIHFGGSNLKMNKQYSYYSNLDAQMLDKKSWSTEMGALSKLELEIKNYGDYDLPVITADWKSNDMSSGEVLIRPIISGDNAGKFYYRMYTSSWEVYGYKDFTEEEFNSILKEMCEYVSIDFSSIQTSINEEINEDSEILFVSHHLDWIDINLPSNFTVEKMYEDTSPDFCDYSIKFNDVEIIQIHSLLKSRFEFTDVNTLYEAAINNSEFDVTYKMQKDDWFVVSGLNVEDQNIIYWKRLLGEVYISDLRFSYPDDLQNSVGPLIGEIAKSFTTL